MIYIFAKYWYLSRILVRIYKFLVDCRFVGVIRFFVVNLIVYKEYRNSRLLALDNIEPLACIIRLILY